MQLGIPEWAPPPAPGQPMAWSPREVFNTFITYLRHWQESLRLYLNQVNTVINTGVMGEGPDIASASTIQVSHYIHRLTGAVTIQTVQKPINLPPSHIVLIAMAGISFGTAGNIAAGKTLVAGEAVMLTWHAVSGKWHPTN